jgi:CRP/FNR family transcriptional regulator, anaerobic regulatory protein
MDYAWATTSPATLSDEPAGCAQDGPPAAARACRDTPWIGDLAAREAALHGVLPPRLQRVPAGTTLVHENGTAHCFHMVLAGDFKLCKVSADGYEQVLDFAGRFDVLGFDGLGSGRYAASAVALEDASVYTMGVAEVEALRRASPAFDRQWQAALGRQLSRLGELAVLMAAVSADRRVARFLLQLSRRMAGCGQSPRRLRLRMSRRDIASHLGLAHESISRALGTLGGLGLLEVHFRDIEIADHAGLEDFARCTRGGDPVHARGASASRATRAVLQRAARPVAQAAA